MTVASETLDWPDGSNPLAELLVPDWPDRANDNVLGALVTGPAAPAKPLTRDDLVAAMKRIKDRVMGMADAATIGLEPARLFPNGVPDVLPLYLAVFRTYDITELPTMLELVDGQYRLMEGDRCVDD